MAFFTNIETTTLRNTNYRKVIYTDHNIQIVLMNLQPGEDIPLETHTGTQFIRVEGGKGEAIVAGKKYALSDGGSITIPPHTKHYVKNTSDEPLTLYSIYSPPEHKRGLVQKYQPS
jgi:quercetin dioxygenase-like cupin family protein